SPMPKWSAWVSSPCRRYAKPWKVIFPSDDPACPKPDGGPWPVKEPGAAFLHRPLATSHRPLFSGPRATVSGFDRVIALARLSFLILVRHPHIHVPVGAVLHIVGRRVSDRVLAAHFVLQLLENVVQRVPAVHFVDVASGFVGHLT